MLFRYLNNIDSFVTTNGIHLFSYVVLLRFTLVNVKKFVKSILVLSTINSTLKSFYTHLSVVLTLVG